MVHSEFICVTGISRATDGAAKDCVQESWLPHTQGDGLVVPLFLLLSAQLMKRQVVLAGGRLLPLKLSQ